jgi:hypothetical protein
MALRRFAMRKSDSDFVKPTQSGQLPAYRVPSRGFKRKYFCWPAQATRNPCPTRTPLQVANLHLRAANTARRPRVNCIRYRLNPIHRFRFALAFRRGDRLLRWFALIVTQAHYRQRGQYVDLLRNLRRRGRN